MKSRIKTECLAALGLSFTIFLLYYLTGPFYAQIIFVPLTALLLGLVLAYQQGLLPLYPILTSFIYFLGFAWWAQTFEHSSLILALMTTLMPNVLGQSIGYFLKRRQKPKDLALLAIFSLSTLIITTSLIIRYAAVIRGDSLIWCDYLLLPLTFFLANFLAVRINAKHWLMPLLLLAVYAIISLFTAASLPFHLICLYAIISYAGCFLGPYFLKNS